MRPLKFSGLPRAKCRLLAGCAVLLGQAIIGRQAHASNGNKAISARQNGNTKKLPASDPVFCSAGLSGRHLFSPCAGTKNSTSPAKARPALRHSTRLLVSLEMPREAISAMKKAPTRPSAGSSSAQQPEPITSRDNRWLKLFREALREGFLANENLIGIEGPHLIGEALRSGLPFDVCLVSPAGEKHFAALPSACFAGARVLRTTDRLFDGVAATEHPQGIAALVRPRESTFDDLVRGDIPLVVVLAGVQDPGNVGTVVRSAEAFGATGCAATRGTADPWSSKALRASAG